MNGANTPPNEGLPWVRYCSTGHHRKTYFNVPLMKFPDSTLKVAPNGATVSLFDAYFQSVSSSCELRVSLEPAKASSQNVDTEPSVH